MKAIGLNSFGGPDRLQPMQIEMPEPAAGEVSIDVSFAGVGFVDTLFRGGKFDFVSLPLVPGIEISGHVRAVGPNASGFVRDQPVAALLTDFTRGGMGGYAEVAVAQAALTIPLSPKMDLALAAATVVNGATAVMALEDLKPGSSLAISGASGGLGRSLIATARSAGAGRVVAISTKMERTDELLAAGASDVLSPKDMAGLDVDYVCDTVGGEVRLALLSALRPGGRLMLLGNASGSDAALSGDDIWLRNVSVARLSTGGLSHITPDRIAKAASRALEIAERSIMRPTILPLEDAGEAHRRLEAGKGGKIVLAV